MRGAGRRRRKKGGGSWAVIDWMLAALPCWPWQAGQKQLEVVLYSSPSLCTCRPHLAFSTFYIEEMADIYSKYYFVSFPIKFSSFWVWASSLFFFFYKYFFFLLLMFYYSCANFLLLHPTTLPRPLLPQSVPTLLSCPWVIYTSFFN